MTILFNNKDSLIEDMLNTIKCTNDYLIDMQKQFNEDHKDEIKALKTLSKTYKRHFKQLKNEAGAA
jgi:hypothetical protein